MTKAKPKGPAPAATRARSTTKRATPPPRKGPRGAYSEEQRAEAYAGWRKAVQRTLDWVDV